MLQGLQRPLSLKAVLPVGFRGSSLSCFPGFASKCTAVAKAMGFLSLLLLVLLFLEGEVAAMGWQGPGRWKSYGSYNKHYQQGGYNHRSSDGPQVIRVELGENRRRSRSPQKTKKSKKSRKSSSSSSSVSDDRRKSSKSKQSRLQAELKALREEKAAREEAEREKAFKDELMAQVRAAREEMREEFASSTNVVPTPVRSGKATPRVPASGSQGTFATEFSAAHRLIIHQALGGYEGVKSCGSWDELSNKLATETDDDLKALYKSVIKKGAVPKSTGAQVCKIVTHFQRLISAFEEGN